MFNKLSRRLLLMGIVVLAVLLATTVMQPVHAQLDMEGSISSPSASIFNQPTRIPESGGTVVILPASYSQENTYPALVLLPFSGGTAANLFDRNFAQQYASRTESPFIVILLAGEGSDADHTASGFGAAVERYNNLVRNNLDVLIPKYSIDPSRVALGGYSLGGDLGWSLSLRNPSRFRGVIAIGSQSNDRNELSMPQLAANHSRFFMIMGEEDWRLQNMRSTVDELARYGVTHRFEIVPGADHNNIFRQYAPREVQQMFTQSVGYVLFNE